MYARLLSMKMGPGTKETAEVVRKKFSEGLKSFPGLDRVYFLADYENGQYVTLAIWHSKEAGEVAFQAMAPKRQEALKGLVEEPPVSQYLEVVEISLPEG